MTSLWLESNLATRHVTLPDGKSLLDPQAKPRPRPIQNLPLDQLQLEAKTHNALIKAGIVTIGQLFQAKISYLCSLQGFHLDSFSDINGALTALNDAIREDGSIDWFHYWKTRDIRIIPSITSPDGCIKEVFQAIPQIVEEVLRQGYNERSWLVIQKRFGLGNTKRLTLEEIGSADGLSRERIRQIEKKALETLQAVLVEQRYGGKSYHLHPAAHQIIQTLHNALEREPGSIILEARLLEGIDQSFKNDPTKANSSLLLLMTLIGAQCLGVDSHNATPTWGYIKPSAHQILEHGVKPLRIRRKDAVKEKKIAVPRPERAQKKKIAAPRPERTQRKKLTQPQPDGADTLIQEKLRPFQPYLALYEQIEECAHRILDAAPDKQMPMTALVLQLQQQFEWPGSMISSYLKVVDSLERIDVPGTTKKMYQSKRTIESEH